MFGIIIKTDFLSRQGKLASVARTRGIYTKSQCASTSISNLPAFLFFEVAGLEI